MAVKLKDAKITVKVDLQSASKNVDSLEKRTKEQRDSAAKQMKEIEKKWNGAVGKFGKAKSLVSAVVGGGLYQSVVGIMKSIPIAGWGIGIGIGVNELNERFGPLIHGIVEETLTERFGPLGGAIGSLPSSQAKLYSRMKAELTSIGTGISAATDVGAADILTGGTFEGGEFADVFGKTREYAKAQTLLSKAIRNMNQRLLGEGIARSAKKAIEDALGSGSEQK